MLGTCCGHIKGHVKDNKGNARDMLVTCLKNVRDTLDMVQGCFMDILGKIRKKTLQQCVSFFFIKTWIDNVQHSTIIGTGQLPKF